MILGGILIKNHFGVQGVMRLTEGSGSNKIVLPNTYTLHVENRTDIIKIPLKKASLGPISSPFKGLELTIIEWAPHSSTKLEGWIKGDFGHILGFPPFPVRDLSNNFSDSIPLSLRTPNYNIYALRTAHTIDNQIDAICDKCFLGTPTLIFIQGEGEIEHLIAIGETGRRFSQTFDGNLIWIFDKGFGGYGLAAQLPTNYPPIELITPLTRVCERAQPHRKQEELIPRLQLLVSNGTNSEIISLSYDSGGSHFKWPILNGSYLLRFQPHEQSIPYHVRLHQAKQINYRSSAAPYSFESDLVIGGEETTISMNRVFEKKGYRFYMAKLTTPHLGAKGAHIVINHDPAKYWLTYPGGALLIVGTILLYLQRGLHV